MMPKNGSSLGTLGFEKVAVMSIHFAVPASHPQNIALVPTAKHECPIKT